MPVGRDQDQVHVAQRLARLGARHDLGVPLPAVGVDQVAERGSAGELVVRVADGLVPGTDSRRGSAVRASVVQTRSLAFSNRSR